MHDAVAVGELERTGDLQGDGGYLESGSIVAANPKIFSQMVQALSPYRSALIRDQAKVAAS